MAITEAMELLFNLRGEVHLIILFTTTIHISVIIILIKDLKHPHIVRPHIVLLPKGKHMGDIKTIILELVEIFVLQVFDKNKDINILYILLAQDFLSTTYHKSS
tara:strand:- start:265 stop:576 length:312 start_codon:yes stop_codon:yes gene_type:complete